MSLQFDVCVQGIEYPVAVTFKPRPTQRTRAQGRVCVVKTFCKQFLRKLAKTYCIVDTKSGIKSSVEHNDSVCVAIATADADPGSNYVVTPIDTICNRCIDIYEYHKSGMYIHVYHKNASFRFIKHNVVTRPIRLAHPEIEGQRDAVVGISMFHTLSANQTMLTSRFVHELHDSDLFDDEFSDVIDAGEYKFEELFGQKELALLSL